MDDSSDDEFPEVMNFNRMAATPSVIIRDASLIAERYLNNISDTYPASFQKIEDIFSVVTNSISTIQFTHHEHRCHITLKHHSPTIVMMRMFQNEVQISRAIMWDPHLDPWVILYLIAGYYQIPAAVLELHKVNKAFCQTDRDSQMRSCKVCKAAISKKRPISRSRLGRFRLVPMYND